MKIKKTYKLFINGQFPRTESGQYFQSSIDNNIVNLSRASRKDLRDAIQAARTAFNGWSNKTAYNRGQILYRIAEMTGNSDTITELISDRLIWYAGWADKISTFGSINQVNGQYLNFTIPEPMGVVGMLLSKESTLLSLASLMAPIIVSGNTVVIITTNSNIATNAIDFAEIINTSDVPAGVVNVLTCDNDSLYNYVANHMDVNAIVTDDKTAIPNLKKSASANLKRIFLHYSDYWYDHSKSQNPYWILDTMEAKTVWHPSAI